MTTQNKFHVTLKALREKGACVSGYNKLVRTIQDKEFTDADYTRETHLRFAHNGLISIRVILDSNGLDDALWALRCIKNADKDKDIRLFAIWCARQVEHLMDDQRSKNALNVAELYANGFASDGDLCTALAAARDAAMDAAWDDAIDAAWAAAWAAARDAAMDAAWAAARAAAWDPARDAQKNRLIEMLETGKF